MVKGYDHIPGLAGETADPLDLLPSFSGILAAVRVRAGDYYGVNALFSHNVPDNSDP